MHDATGDTTFTVEQIRPGVVLFTQREDFTGAAVPFYEQWPACRYAADVPRDGRGTGARGR
jgi:hypothetical protein